MFIIAIDINEFGIFFTYVNFYQTYDFYLQFIYVNKLIIR